MITTTDIRYFWHRVKWSMRKGKFHDSGFVYYIQTCK